jgi:glucosamine kinase
VQAEVLLLGVDGGGTNCRARLTDARCGVLGEGVAGPANIRFGLDQAFTEILRAFEQCLRQAGLTSNGRCVVACLGLAGFGDLSQSDAARTYPHPFARMVCTSDARVACVGAHAGADGGIVIAGTGSVGWALINGLDHRVGGWGFPASDEGSGAWLGCEAVRRVLWAHDGLIPWTDFLRSVFNQLGADPHAIVRRMGDARPRDFGNLAPTIVEFAARGDVVAKPLMQCAALDIERIALRLLALGATRLSLMGGLAPSIHPLLSGLVKNTIVQPKGDALDGALQLARLEAEKLDASPPTI